YLNPRLWEAEQEAKKKPKKKFRRPALPPAVANKAAEEKKKEEEKKKNVLARRGGVQKLEAESIDAKDVKKKLSEPFNNRFQVKDAMIRFWDFTVIPGRRYQYRVRVRVFNPNYKRDDVSDPAFKR